MDRARGRFNKGDTSPFYNRYTQHSGNNPDDSQPNNDNNQQYSTRNDYGRDPQPNMSNANQSNRRDLSDHYRSPLENVHDVGRKDNDREREKRYRDPSSSSQSGKRMRTAPTYGREQRRRHSEQHHNASNIPTTCTSSKNQVMTIQDAQCIRLKTNYFKLNQPQFTFYQYHVDFEPDPEITCVKRAIFKEATKLVSEVKVYDGGHALYTIKKLGEDTMSFQAIRKQRNRPESEAQPVTIKIKYIKEIMTSHEILKMLNSCMKQMLQKCGFEQMGRNYFDTIDSQIIYKDTYKISIWPGYMTSVGHYDSNNLLMHVGFLNKVVRNETIYDMLQKIRQHQTIEDWQSAFKQALFGNKQGIHVITSYNNKRYQITDVDFDSNPESTFDTKIGPKSFKTYYAEKYQVHIRYLNQPLLVAKSKGSKFRKNEFDTVSLIPELCHVTGLPDEMRKDFQKMKALAQITATNPNNRVDRLRQLCSRINDCRKSLAPLENLGLQMPSEPVTLEGRILPKPSIRFNLNNEIRIEGDFYNKLRDNFYSSRVLEHWYVVVPEAQKCKMIEFVNVMRQCVYSTIRMSEPQIKVVGNNCTRRDLIKALESVKNHDPSLILVVVPDGATETYNLVKRMFCTERMIPTQVITPRVLYQQEGARKSIATKIAIQMNCKIGGIPWSFRVPLSDLLIIGYDVSHDMDNDETSWGALVGVLNQNQTEFCSVVHKIKKGTNISEKFGLDVIKIVKKYTEINGKGPTRILIYRNGVGDGEIQHIKEFEVNEVSKHINEIHLTFVIINKKSNTRLFLEENRSGFKNPLPGTLVDNVVTKPGQYDFFLVPTDVRRGTVSPTYFNVIQDDIKLSTQKFQQLTYYLCHGYFNWTNAVTVPAVCKYAEKLSFLVCQHLHRAPHFSGENRLYFL